jgi:hypothetical protein
MEFDKYKTMIVTLVGVIATVVVGFLNSDQIVVADHALSWTVGIGGIVTAASGAALMIVRNKKGGTPS